MKNQAQTQVLATFSDVSISRHSQPLLVLFDFGTPQCQVFIRFTALFPWLGGGFKCFFIFSLICGDMIQFDLHNFFNSVGKKHHLDDLSTKRSSQSPTFFRTGNVLKVATMHVRLLDRRTDMTLWCHVPIGCQLVMQRKLCQILWCNDVFLQGQYVFLGIKPSKIQFANATVFLVFSPSQTNNSLSGGVGGACEQWSRVPG